MSEGYTDVSKLQAEQTSTDAAFTGIVQANLDPTYTASPAPVETEIPFGRFAPADEASMILGGLERAAMATATGYTGNNGEESC